MLSEGSKMCRHTKRSIFNHPAWILAMPPICAPGVVGDDFGRWEGGVECREGGY